MKSQITTFGKLDFSIDYARSTAVFPALKHAFTAGGIAGNNLVCHITGKTIICSTGWSQPAAGQFRGGAAGLFTLSGPLWSALGGNIIVLAVGSFSGGSVVPFKMGSSAGQGVELSFGTTATVYAAGGNDTFAANGVLTAGVTGVAIAVPSGGTAATRYVTNDSLNTTAGTVTHTGTTAGLVPDEASYVTPNASSFLTGAYVFNFTTAPTDVAAAVAWMAVNPGKIYPAWQGRT